MFNMQHPNMFNFATSLRYGPTVPESSKRPYNYKIEFASLWSVVGYITLHPADYVAFGEYKSGSFELG